MFIELKHILYELLGVELKSKRRNCPMNCYISFCGLASCSHVGPIIVELKWFKHLSNHGVFVLDGRTRSRCW